MDFPNAWGSTCKETFFPSRIFSNPGALWQPRQVSLVIGCAFNAALYRSETRKIKKKQQSRSLALGAIGKLFN
jgi:hypothetical protein